MPMPIRSGASRSLANDRFNSSSSRAMPRAAARLLPHPASAEPWMPKSAHHPVADELVDMPAGGLDGVAHGFEITVEHEHHVVGQLLLRELGEGAQVREQDGDVPLLARQVAGPRARRARGGVGRQQRRDLDIGDRPDLAREAHVGGGAHPLQHPRLGLRGRGHLLGAAADADPAGRAPAPSAAHRRVRDAGRPGWASRMVASPVTSTTRPSG